jgi:hypothetical protein
MEFMSCSCCPKGALGLLSIPSALVLSAGILLKENRAAECDYKQVRLTFLLASSIDALMDSNAIAEFRFIKSSTKPFSVWGQH